MSSIVFDAQDKNLLEIYVKDAFKNKATAIELRDSLIKRGLSIIVLRMMMF